MSGVATLTFRPCIDKSSSVASLSPEIKMSCYSVKEEAGGGGINVARALKKLGSDSTAMYVSGGCIGNKLDKLMLEENIRTLVVSSKNETRENIIIVDEANGKQYRFGMPTMPLSESEYRQFLSKLETMKVLNYIIVSGSMPTGFDMSIFKELSFIAKQKNAKLIIDTKGDALKHALDEGVFLIKPNQGEFGALIGKNELSLQDIKEEAKILINNGKCEVVVISLGAAGAMMVTATTAKQIKPPSVERKSTVGAGDSMVAGIVFALNQGNNIVEAIRYGVACGTAPTLNPGTELCRKADVEWIFPKVDILDL